MVLTSQIGIQPNKSAMAKPLEDYALADDRLGIYIVCDGVTRSLIDGRYPEDSPAAKVAGLFAETVYATLVRERATMSTRSALRVAITAGNDAIRRFNEAVIGQPDYLENDLAGTVAIVAVADDTLLQYAYLGDCCAYSVVGDRLTRLTAPQTANVAEYRKRAGPAENATLAIRRDFRNNRQSDYGYGVFTGEATALEWVEWGQHALGPGRTLILASDGLAPYLDRCPGGLAEASPGYILAEADQLDAQMNLRSDDKAVILIRMT